MQESEQFYETATHGLASDPELRLEVQAELRSRVEGAMAESTEQDASSARRAAMARLGEPAELASALLENNAKRIKARALVRLLLSFFLVPAALLSALLVSPWEQWISPGERPASTTLEALEEAAVPAALFGQSARSRLRENERLIVFGDESEEDPVRRERAILKLDDDDPVYYGNYVSAVMAHKPADLLDILHKASAREPDNARYDWAIAAEHAVQAADLVATEGSQDDRERSSRRLDVRDREQLDRAMARFMRASAAPAYKRYARDMLARRMAIYGQPENFVQSIERVSIVAGIDLPDLQLLQNLVRYSLAYSALLVDEGNPRKAERFALAWQEVARRLQDDSFMLIDVLVVASIIEEGKDFSPLILERLGKEARAAEVRLEAQKWLAPVHNWRTSRQSTSGDAARWIAERAGLIDAMLLPAFGEMPDRGELRGGRLLDYHLLLGITARHMPILAACLLTACWMLGLRWRSAPKTGYGSMLLMPRLADQTRLWLLGLFLPVLTWIALTAIPCIGGRGYSLRFTIFRAPAQLSVLAVTILLVVSHLARKSARQRCRFLGITAPQHAAWRSVGNRLAWCLLAIAATLAFFPALQANRFWLGTIPLFGLCALGVLLLLKLGLCLTGGWTWLTDTPHGTYYGTLARSVVPSFAMAILLMSWLPMIPLSTIETRLIQQSSWGRTSVLGFTAVEDRLTQRLLAEMDATKPQRN
jgi:hypothetical protein